MNQPNLTILTILAASLVALAALSIAGIPTGNGSYLEIFATGYLFGSVFGNAITASAWAALGPGWFLIRLPLSLLWIALVALAVFGNAWMNDIPLSEGVSIAICLLGIWLLVQVPYWLLQGFGEMMLRNARDQSPPERAQYGVRQLFIFTAIVAVIFGVGRAAAVWIPSLSNLGGFMHIFPFIYLALATLLVSLPLPLAMLMPRYAGYAILGMLLLNVLATLIELPLLRRFFAGPGPQLMHFVWLNVFTAAWILAFSGLLRWGGYRLRTTRSAHPKRRT
jgi:hypothetical protein